MSFCSECGKEYPGEKLLLVSSMCDKRHYLMCADCCADLLFVWKGDC